MNIEQQGPDMDSFNSANRIRETRIERVLEKCRESMYWGCKLPNVRGWSIGDVIETLSNYDGVNTFSEETPEKIFLDWFCRAKENLIGMNVLSALEEYGFDEDEIRSIEQRQMEVYEEAGILTGPEADYLVTDITFDEEKPDEIIFRLANGDYIKKDNSLLDYYLS